MDLSPFTPQMSSSPIDYFHKLKFLRNKSQEKRHHNRKSTAAGSRGSQASSSPHILESPDTPSAPECSRLSGTVPLPVSPPAVEFRMPIYPEYQEEPSPTIATPQFSSPNLQNELLELWFDQMSPATPAKSSSAGTVTERLALLRSACRQDRQQLQQEELEDCYLFLEHEYFVYRGGSEWISCDPSELSAELPTLPPPRVPFPSEIYHKACVKKHLDADAQFSASTDVCANSVDNSRADCHADVCADSVDDSRADCHADVCADSVDDSRADCHADVCADSVEDSRADCHADVCADSVDDSRADCHADVCADSVDDSRADCHADVCADSVDDSRADCHADVCADSVDDSRADCHADVCADSVDDSRADCHADVCADSVDDSRADCHADVCADSVDDSRADCHADVCADSVDDSRADCHADVCANSFSNSSTEVFAGAWGVTSLPCQCRLAPSDDGNTNVENCSEIVATLILKWTHIETLFACVRPFLMQIETKCVKQLSNSQLILDMNDQLCRLTALVTENNRRKSIKARRVAARAARDKLYDEEINWDCFPDDYQLPGASM